MCWMLPSNCVAVEGLVRRVVHSDDSGPIINMFFHELTSEGVNQQCNHGLVAESAATGHLYSISCCTHDETLPTAVYCEYVTAIYYEFLAVRKIYVNTF